MAETTVSFLLDKMSALLQEEVNLQRGVQHEIQYIKEELERHMAILRVADALEGKDPELKVWLQRVREIAEAMEDAIDEFNYQDNKSSSTFSKIKNMKARHEIASEIQQIKSRLEFISKERPSLYRVGSRLSPRLPSKIDSQGDALLLEEADLVGIDKPKKQLCDLLFSNEAGRFVIPIHGMGGLGKTTLAKQVYDDAKVKKRFKIHAWVSVSHPFQIEELLKDLVHQLHNVIGKPAPEEVGQMRSDKLKEVIKNLLQQSRYLIVLDDVWHINVWDSVKLALPNNNRGSRVMLTTRNKSVALYSCTELGKDFHPEFLPEQEAWSLFCRKTFQDNSCPPHLEEVCQKILKMCGGLPLAIVAIGGALTTTNKANIEEWQIVYRSFGSEIEGNDKLENMNKVLLISFNELPYYLKSCLMYLSIFPEFHAIEHMRLIRLWIAEGFVIEEGGKTLEEVAESYLKELLDRSLLQVVEKTSDGRMKTCRMHDVLREIINLKSKDQNFATVVKEQSIVWPERVRRLSLINTTHNIQQNRTTFQLRSLLMFALSDSLDHFSIQAVCSTGYKLLRVLDLQDAPLEVFPDGIVTLFLLKYLSLRNTKVKRIPSSIKKLKQLETLDLKHSHVTELPVEIVELHMLRHLLVYRYEVESYAYFHSRHGFKLAAPIGKMQSLQKLCFIEADQGGKALMVELGRLIQLRRLGIRKMREEDGAALCSSIEKMINLQSLSVTAIEDDKIIDIHNISSPPQFLQRLYLSGRLEKFPQWISTLKNLAKLHLKWSQLKEDPLVYLQGLPNLRHLELLHVYVGETLHFRAKGFPSLKILGLDDLDGLKHMIVEEGAMPGLKKLIMQRCKSFKQAPKGIEHLSKLKTIEFFDMPEELITALLPNGGQDNWRVQHVPAVYSSYWRDRDWDVYSLETFAERAYDCSHDAAMSSHEIRTLWKV
ncbi:disease resistance protein RPM1-like [Arachis stenosperma]|uniref:disease resistance protein RPM1-like n=1 Tax=Arachis stenosperma TaxID=217475 RepID=UPI0025AD580D|nr:disease resistance protein RPM1-like [Arachis stenosperma]